MALLALSGLVAAHVAAQSNDLKDKVAIDQKLGAQIPLDLTFTDETGKSVTLRDEFGKRPVVLNLVFYACRGVCTEILLGLTRSFKSIKIASVGKDFDVLTVSIHPKETPEMAAGVKGMYLDLYQRPTADAGWHFLTGSQENIAKLADAVGFRYTYDPVKDVISHPAGIMILTPQGKVSRYFYGVEYTAKMLLPAIEAAGHEEIGQKVEPIFFGCIGYDPKTHKYVLIVESVLKVAGILTVVVLGGSILLMSLKSTRSRNRPVEGGQA